MENISELIPSKFKKTDKLKKSGLAGLFSASLELTKAWNLDYSDKTSKLYLDLETEVVTVVGGYLNGKIIGYDSVQVDRYV